MGRARNRTPATTPPITAPIVITITQIVSTQIPPVNLSGAYPMRDLLAKLFVISLMADWLKCKPRVLYRVLFS